MPTSEEIARELESFYRHYVDIFNHEDARFVAYYAPVFQIVSGDSGILSVTNDARYWSNFMKALKQRGWVRSEVDRLKAWAIAHDLGMIIPDITRRKADNSVLDQMRGIYTARRSGNSWQFIPLSEIKPPYLGPGQANCTTRTIRRPRSKREDGTCQHRKKSCASSKSFYRHYIDVFNREDPGF